MFDHERPRQDFHEGETLVIDLLADHLKQLRRTHRVKTLEGFGTLPDGTFDPARGDLDFLIVFQPTTGGSETLTC